MSASWKIANVVVLPLCLALASAGCAAQPDEDASEPEALTADDGAGDVAESESVGTAEQPFCGGGWGGGWGAGRWGGGWGGWGHHFRPWGGCGFGGGWARPLYGVGGGGCW